jgi:hypothetical protein
MKKEKNVELRKIKHFYLKLNQVPIKNYDP